MAGRVSRILSQLADTKRRYGFIAALKLFTGRAVRKLLRMEVFELMHLEMDRLPHVIEAPPEFTFRFLNVDEVADLVADQRYGLPSRYIRYAQSGAHFCFAALHHGKEIASYNWYALGSIEGRHHLGVSLSSSAHTAFVYQAFTLPMYRGRRLHGTATALALQQLAERGVCNLVSTIEWTNFASLRSRKFVNFMKLGRLWTFHFGDPCRYWSPKRARRLGIRFSSPAKTLPRTK